MLLHHGGAQILSVRDEGAEGRRGEKREQDRPHIAAEALRVLHDQIDAQREEQEAPRIVDHDELRDERNVIVDGGLRGPVVVLDKVLDDEKQGQIDRQDEGPPDVRVLSDPCFDALHTGSSVTNEMGKFRFRYCSTGGWKKIGESDICHSFFTICDPG